jgi:hypothetical protein
MLFTKKGQRVMRIFGIAVAIIVAFSMVFTYFAYSL